MSCISININYLIRKENVGNDEFGRMFGLNRGAISSYIHGKSQPKIETLQKISEYYNISIDDLINCDLTHKQIENKTIQTEGKCQSCMEKERVIAALEKTILSKEETIEAQKDVIESLKKRLSGATDAQVAHAG